MHCSFCFCISIYIEINVLQACTSHPKCGRRDMLNHLYLHVEICFQDIETLASTSSCSLPASLTETIWRSWEITDLIIDLKAAGLRRDTISLCASLKRAPVAAGFYLGSSRTEFSCCSYCPNIPGIVCM